MNGGKSPGVIEWLLDGRGFSSMDKLSKLGWIIYNVWGKIIGTIIGPGAPGCNAHFALY